MKIIGVLLAALFLVVASSGVCFAAEVVDAVVCLDVQDREPVEPGDLFPADVGEVWCWSKIKDGKGETIRHIYYYEGEEKAVVELSIGSPMWRTRSSKRIISSWTGNWRVDIVGEDDVTLKSLAFRIGGE